MRIVLLVIYFCFIFYGAELMIPSPNIETTSSAISIVELPKKETVQNNSICAEYSTYIRCESLHSHEVRILPIKKLVPPIN